VLDRTLKTLESKGVIRPMKNVKNPQRKMFIVAGLHPNEEATGGAWYTEGKLDSDLVNVIGAQVEAFVSEKSWAQVNDQSQPLINNNNNKRKAPHDDFHVKGKGKAKVARIDDDQPRSISPELKHKSKHRKAHAPKSYVPRDPGYSGYPTLSDITRYVNTSKVTASIFPQNAIAQLIDIMVYDERLFPIERPTRDDEIPDNSDNNKVTMYRCFNSPAAHYKAKELYHMSQSIDSATRRAARREYELDVIGRGGTSEIPCIECPAADLCGDGGPINVRTCPYFDEWYIKAAKADIEADPWPGGDEFIREGEAKKEKRLKKLPPVPIKVEVEEKGDGDVPMNEE
jgi:DNA-directed RNA polymerase III subunit RPC6